MLRVVQDEAARVEFAGVLDEIVRDGARRMLAAALESEVDSYVAAATGERDDKGHALVTRNGKARARTVVTGAGALEVRAPRVNDRRTDEQSERVRFASDILPPYARKSPKVSQVLPLLYLHGLMFRSPQAKGGARKKGLAAHGMPVRRIDGCCQYLHQDFIGVRPRLLDLRHPKRLRRPVLLPYERLHDGPPGFR